MSQRPPSARPRLPRRRRERIGVVGAAVLASAALVATLLAGTRTSVAAPEDAPPAGPSAPTAAVDFYAERAADVARSAAQKLWNAVEDARRTQLFECARREARRVLDLDPDHKGARALLGFERRDSGWVEDPAAAAKAPRVNFPDRAPPPEQVATVERRWWKDVLPAARSAAAAVWTALGEECVRRTDKGGADKAFGRAITLDPDQDRARRGLGHARWQKVWMTEQQYRRVQAACRGAAVDEEGPVDKAFGVKLEKVRTAHFQVESRIPADRLLAIATALETAYAVHMVEIGRDPTESVFPAPVRMVLCETDRDWDSWVNGFVVRNREFYRGLDGVWGDGWQYGMKRPEDGTDETRRDHLVHRVVHAVDSFALGIHWPHWTDESLAHLTTIRVQGMTRTWCLAPSRSEYQKLKRPGEGKAGWVDEDEWRRTVRSAAAARDDVPLRTLVLQPFPELGFGAVMKGWSVLDSWRATDPESFRAFLALVRRAKDPAATIERHFGKDLETLDEDWRRYVLRTY